MTVSSHRLELLSPARDAAIAREAILHGADAVYIGGPGFGARHNASNSLKDIAELVPFAHRYGAKIFVTLNTILHDDELEPAQRLITDLYQTGVDALIVQDMGIWNLIFRRLNCTPVRSATFVQLKKRSSSLMLASRRLCWRES
ncbi:hypothetical protein ESCOCK369M_02945 [Escherichia coli]